MAASIDQSERLLNLVIALVNTRHRMTKEQVRSSVAGYGGASGDDAFERMFERDKDTLRDLGVPLVTVTGSGHGDDVGYRIDPDAYSLAPVELTPAELGVLSLASQVWQDQVLASDSTRALTKLRAVGEVPDAGQAPAGLAPRLRAGQAFAPLVDALHARQVVQFTYRAASTGEVRPRTVQPWRLLARRGGWVLVGLDVDRGEPRSFRVGRIEGKVRTVGAPGAFAEPDGSQVAAALQAWAPHPERTAALAVRPEGALGLRARARAADALPALDTPVAACPADRDLVLVPFRAGWELAEELVGYGDAVVVLGPSDVRASVLHLLRTAARLDADQGEEVARG